MNTCARRFAAEYTNAAEPEGLIEIRLTPSIAPATGTAAGASLSSAIRASSPERNTASAKSCAGETSTSDAPSAAGIDSPGKLLPAIPAIERSCFRSRSKKCPSLGARTYAGTPLSAIAAPCAHSSGALSRIAQTSVGTLVNARLLSACGELWTFRTTRGGGRRIDCRRGRTGLEHFVENHAGRRQCPGQNAAASAIH